MLILDHDVLEVILSAFMEQLKPALNSKCVEVCGNVWAALVFYQALWLCSLCVCYGLFFDDDTDADLFFLCRSWNLWVSKALPQQILFYDDRPQVSNSAVCSALVYKWNAG